MIGSLINNHTPRLSKSKFVAGVQCLKRLYLQVFEPEEAADNTPGTQVLLEQGHAVGLEAQRAFPGGVLVGADHEHIADALKETALLIENRTVPAIFEAALEHNVVVFPGALTPSEVIAAWKRGVDFVKIFPCSQLGGPAYIRSLKVPLPQIRLIASGGVNQHSAANFILAGASALGIGNELIPQEALQRKQEEQIQELSRRFLHIVKSARAQVASTKNSGEDQLH